MPLGKKLPWLMDGGKQDWTMLGRAGSKSSGEFPWVPTPTLGQFRGSDRWESSRQTAHPTDLCPIEIPAGTAGDMPAVLVCVRYLLLSFRINYHIVGHGGAAG